MTRIGDFEDDDRVSIPLMMFRGNLEALLENEIEVSSIRLRHYGVKGVILMVGVSESQKEEAAKKGFKTGPIGEPPE